MTLGELVNAETALTALVNTDRTVPAKSSYHVARLVKSVTTHLEPFHKERNALLERLGTKAEENGNSNGTVQYRLEGENATTFAKEMTELLQTEVDIDKWQLSLALLDDYQPSTQHMLQLLPLIVVDEAS